MIPLVALGTAALGTAALAPTPAPVDFLALGFAEVTRADLGTGAGAPQRTASSTALLAASCDLDRDGILDEARIVRELRTGETMVVAALRTNGVVRAHVVERFPAAELATMGIAPASVGARAVGRCDALRVFTLGTLGRLYLFTRGAFRSVQM